MESEDDWEEDRHRESEDNWDWNDGSVDEVATEHHEEHTGVTVIINQSAAHYVATKACKPVSGNIRHWHPKQ